ncbi:MAG: hypothetical protein JNM69_23870 [Archangium sp.]|nr:hypothetical protein [Archangium sp.]
MALDVSPVFRQLDGGGRFARFSPTDAIPVLLVYSVTYLGTFVVDYSPLYAFVALAAAAVATWLLRVKFEFGLMELLKFLLAPKHLSALAADRVSAAYPGRRIRGDS